MAPASSSDRGAVADRDDHPYATHSFSDLADEDFDENDLLEEEKIFRFLEEGAVALKDEDANMLGAYTEAVPTFQLLDKEMGLCDEYLATIGSVLGEFHANLTSRIIQSVSLGSFTRT